MKKILSCIVAFVMAITFITPIQAQESEIQTYYLSQEEIEKNLQDDLENIMASLNSSSVNRIPEYDSYRYEEQDSVDISASGWAGNTPPGGICYPDGGLFYWNPNGGPNVSVSLGASYHGVSIGISLGVQASNTTAYLCNVPAGNSFYRLWVKPTYRVVPTKVYGRRIGTSNYVYLYTIYPKTLYDYVIQAKKVA